MREKGFSLLEVLVVMGLFAVLGILSTRAVLLSLQGSKKSDSLVRVRENANYALAIVERQLRNADEVSPCPNPAATLINYKDNQGIASSFACVDTGENGYVASGSSRLTTDEIAIITCSFVCSAGSSGLPPEVTVNLVARDSGTVSEKSQVSLKTTILLRTY